jgi:hypothetical protein
LGGDGSAFGFVFALLLVLPAKAGIRFFALSFFVEKRELPLT